MDQFVVGLDIAGNTGITEGWADAAKPIRCYSKRFRLEDDDSAIPAMGRATAFVARLINDQRPVAVFVEDLIPMTKVASNFHSNLIQIGLFGAIIGMVRARNIPVFPASIARVRTHFLGRGHKLAGREAKRAVFNRCESLGWAPTDLDASDSAAVWDWGCAQVRFGALENAK